MAHLSVQDIPHSHGGLQDCLHPPELDRMNKHEKIEGE